MIASPWNIIAHHLYLLQLENYDLKRYFGVIKKTGALARHPS